MKPGCLNLGVTLLPVALLTGLFWAIVAAFVPHGRLGENSSFGVTAMGTVFGTMLAAFAYLAFENAKALRRLARANRGETPPDGADATFVGVLEARTGEILAAPFSGRAALAYGYRVGRWEQKPNGTKYFRPMYGGEVMAPCELRTEAGRVLLLGRPNVDHGQEVIGSADVYERAGRFLAERFPYPIPTASIAPGGSRPAEGDSQGGEATSGFQKHWRNDVGENLPRPFVVSLWTLFESIYSVGETVCVSGVWSREKGGLGPPEGGTEGLLIERGDLRAAMSRRRVGLAKWGFVGFLMLLVQIAFVAFVWAGFR